MADDEHKVRLRPSLVLTRDVLLLLHPVLVIAFVALRSATMTRTIPSGIEDIFFLRVMRLLRLAASMFGGSFWPNFDRVQPLTLGLVGGVFFLGVYLLSCVCIAVLITVASRVLLPPSIRRALLHPSIGLVALLAWLLAWWLANRDAAIMEWLWCWYSPLRWLALLVLVVSGILGYYAARRRCMGTGVAIIYGIFLTTHFGFWLITITARFFLPFALISVAVAAKGIVWLARQPAPPAVVLRPVRWKALAAALMSVALLWSIWLPGRAYAVSRAVDIRSLTIELYRGGGLGAARSYLLTIHGDGRIQYVGVSKVGIVGSQTASLTQKEIRALAERLDRIDFFSLESRLFPRCADSIFTEIVVSVDGRRKVVYAEPCDEVQTGTLGAFLRLAQDIDRGAGSDRWTRCDGPCPTVRFTSAREALVRFCGMDLNGDQLSPEGSKNVATFFTSADRLPSHKITLVKDFVVSQSSDESGKAPLYVEYLTLGEVDLVKSAFVPTPPMKTRAEFNLTRQVHSHDDGRKAVVWLIEGPVPSPHVSVDAAIRYFTSLGASTKDPQRQQRLEKLVAELRLHVPKGG